MSMMSLRSLAMSILLVGGAGALSAQTQRTVDIRTILRPNPKADAQTQVSGFLRTFDLQHGAARDVFEAAPQYLTLTNVDLPGNSTATLQLHRTRAVFDANTKFVTMTKEGPKEFKVRPITSYLGTVEGSPGSRVSLHYGLNTLTGVIEDAVGNHIVISEDMNGVDRESSTPHMLADEQVAYGGNILSKFLCGNENLPVDPAVTNRLMSTYPSKAVEALQDDDMRELRLAIVLREDIDEFMKSGGATDEQIAQYFATIIACASQAYEQEFNTTLYIPTLIKHTSDEPSGYVADGVSPQDLLEEFSADWGANYTEVERDAAHLFTMMRSAGGRVVGGIAYLGQLCNRNNRGAFGVSTVSANVGELPGRPTVRNGFVWDYYVVAHELGHNVGSFHTHSCFWTPLPIDTCQVKEDNTDACFSLTKTSRKIVPGTIMSYCHLVNGGTIPLTFGDRVAPRMRGWVEASCLKRPEQPTIRITYPRGIEEWSAGSVVNIKWASYRVSNLRLEMSTNEGSSWTLIADNVPAVERDYDWTLPSVTAPRVWIRALDAQGSGAADTTLAPYSITSQLSITDPNGGERIAQGSTYTVKWMRQPSVAAVDVEFAADGTTWTPVASGVTATTTPWIVPSIVTGNARMRVTSSNNASVRSTGGEFSIGTPFFELVIPEPGATICTNQPNQFRWSGDFIDRIRIQYSTDGGAQWRNAVQQTSYLVSDWQIFSRAGSLGSVPENTPCIIRVLDNATDVELDRVENLVIKPCDAPVSVQEQDVQPTDLRIVGVTPNPASSDAVLTFDAARAMTIDVVLVGMDGTSTMLLSGLAVEPGSGRQVVVPVAGASSGAYQLMLRAGKVSVTVPFTVVR